MKARDHGISLSRRYFGILVVLGLFVPALCLFGCSKKQETVSTQSRETTTRREASPTGSDTARAEARSSPQEVRAGDSGKTLTYHVGDTFTVILNEETYPKVQLSFAPGGIISIDSAVPQMAPPNYAVEFDAVAPGEVVLANGTFTVTIRIVS